MDALLVLNNKNFQNCRVMVRVNQKKMIDLVVSLLEEDKGRQAFDILMKQAEVIQYIPYNKQTPKKPMMLTLYEELL